MKTSTACTSEKVRLQIQVRYSFAGAIYFQSTFCFSCVPDSACALMSLPVPHYPNCLRMYLGLWVHKITGPFCFVSIQEHKACLKNGLWSSQAASFTFDVFHRYKAGQRGWQDIHHRVRASLELLFPLECNSQQVKLGRTRRFSFVFSINLLDAVQAKWKSLILHTEDKHRLITCIVFYCRI